MRLNLGFVVIEWKFNIRKKHERINQYPCCDYCIHRKEHMFMVDTCDIDNYTLNGTLIDGYWECKYYEEVKV